MSKFEYDTEILTNGINSYKILESNKKIYEGYLVLYQTFYRIARTNVNITEEEMKSKKGHHRIVVDKFLSKIPLLLKEKNYLLVRARNNFCYSNFKNEIIFSPEDIELYSKNLLKILEYVRDGMIGTSNIYSKEAASTKDTTDLFKPKGERN